MAGIQGPPLQELESSVVAHSEGQGAEAGQAAAGSSRWADSAGYWNDQLPPELESDSVAVDGEQPSILQGNHTDIGSDGPAVPQTSHSMMKSVGRVFANFLKRTTSRYSCCNRHVLEPVWNCINFYRLHFLYFIIVDLIGTFIIWLSPPTSLGQISFIDALYNATSALTVTGLVSVRMATFSTFNQCILMILMLLGGGVFTSLLPVLIRRYYFHLRIQQAAKEKQSNEKDEKHSVESGHAKQDIRRLFSVKSQANDHLRTIKENQALTSTSDLTELNPGHSNAISSGVIRSQGIKSFDEGITSDLTMPPPVSDNRHKHGSNFEDLQLHSRKDIESAAAALKEANARISADRHSSRLPHSHSWSGETKRDQDQRFGLAFDIFMGKKMLSHISGSDGGSSQDGESLLGNSMKGIDTWTPATSHDGSVEASKLRIQEYRALRTLSWLVPAYLLGIQIVAFLAVRLNFAAAPGQRRILANNGIDLTFFSGFQVASAFQNAGYGLLDTSLIEFQKAVLLIHVFSILILLGNTLYAPTMRGIIYLLARWTKADEKDVHGLQYLLDHPRKCFTHLFPWHQTLWLVVTVIIFNSLEVFFFCVLEWNVAALADLSGGYKFLVGLFQSLNTRSSGFSVVPLGELTPSMLVLYSGMMYIAVYPVYLSRQTSRPGREIILDRATSSKRREYDGLDLGIYEDVLNGQDQSLLAQGRQLLFRDSAFLFISIFIISIVQTDEIRNDPNFDIFHIIFEVISAYGNVGLSVGYTCVGDSCESPPYSFSGVWKTLSKLVIILVMLMGRHRGLPDNIDDAVQIPPLRTFKKGAFVEGVVDPVEAYLFKRARRQLQRSQTVFESISKRFGGYSPLHGSPQENPELSRVRRAVSIA